MKESKDMIRSFNDFKALVKSKSDGWIIDSNDEVIRIIKISPININMAAKIIITIYIDVNMNLQLYNDNILINISKYLNNNILDRWSNWENILHDCSIIHVPEYKDVCFTISKMVKMNLNIRPENTDIGNFFGEQIELLGTSPNHRRYSPQCIIFAYTILNRSRSSYKLVRNFITSLPSLRFLIDLSSNLNSNETVFYDYIKTKAKYLNQDEMLINIQLDEIYVKPKITFQTNKLLGFSNNTEEVKLASR